MKKANFIYIVSFKEPPFEDEIKNYHFTSLSAIYEQFTPEQIGCKVSRLWNLKIASGVKYQNKICSITKELLYSKKQNAPQIKTNMA